MKYCYGIPWNVMTTAWGIFISNQSILSLIWKSFLLGHAVHIPSCAVAELDNAVQWNKFGPTLVSSSQLYTAVVTAHTVNGRAFICNDVTVICIASKEHSVHVNSLNSNIPSPLWVQSHKPYSWCKDFSGKSTPLAFYCTAHSPKYSFGVRHATK